MGSYLSVTFFILDSMFYYIICCYVVNLVFCGSVWRHPCLFVNSLMWEKVTTDPHILGCCKRNESYPVVIGHLMQTFLANCGFKNSFFPDLCVEVSHHYFRCSFRYLFIYSIQLAIELFLNLISFFLCCCIPVY